MRLIDADALKKRICIDEPIRYTETWEELYDAIIKAIDEAQTIKFPEEEKRNETDNT